MQIVGIKLKGAKGDAHLRFAYNVKDDDAERLKDNLTAAKTRHYVFVMFQDANSHFHAFSTDEIRDIHITGEKISG